MSSQRTKILILSSDYGEGHQQVAVAITQALRLQYPQIEARIVNVMELLFPRLHPISRSMFLQSVKKIPSLYGYFYRKTSEESTTSNWLNELPRFGLKRLQRLLAAEAPTVVVSTFPFASAAMSLLREHGVTSVPLVTVITDQAVHRAWIHPQTDHYLVGSQPVRAGLQKNGVPAEQITVTGIPLRPVFSRTYPKYLLRAHLQLDPMLPTVLLMGGGCGIFGSGLFDRKQLDRLPNRIQFIIICGHNEKVKTALEQELQNSRHKIVIKGFVDNIHEWMSASDLILTKPGGVTTAEAMALEIPLLLYKPLPGQEEENLRFLVEKGVGQFVPAEQMLLEKLFLMLQDPVLLSNMQNCAKIEGRKQAAHDAIQAILTLAQQAKPRTLLSV